MTKSEIEKFRSLAPLLLPKLIEINHLDAIDDYDDYAMLTFSLAEPMTIDAVLNEVEDQMEMNVLYHMRTTNATDAGQQCCAYSNPMFGHMYKFNAQTEDDGLVHSVYVYIFSSLEFMLEALKEDHELHTKTGIFYSKMELSNLYADFM